jgi:predicted nuclease with TOPRIM domain
MENNINVKNKLDASKTRLAEAFNKLESVIDKMANKKDNQAELISVKEKLLLLSQENIKLANNLSSLETDYHNIKSISFEVMDELNTSISTIETILGTK